MWLFMCIKRLQLLILVIHINATVSASNDLSIRDLGRDISALENDEIGFDFNNEEMGKLKIWPKGVIPYYIDTLSFDTEFSKKLEEFLKSVSEKTGVQFMKLSGPPKDESFRWVFFINRRGVQGTDGYTTKDFTNQEVQKVVVGYDSPLNGELYETILAILGIPPQHNAPNRDDFITVKFDNILSDKKKLFEKLKDDEWLFHDLGYDLFSAGHYGLHKYTKDGQATIETKFNAVDGIGDGKGFSFTDIWKIRMMYNYITKTPSKSIQLSNCQKMFLPGDKFFPLPELPRLPRRKPNKYLGKPDDDFGTKQKIRYDDSLSLRTTKSIKRTIMTIKPTNRNIKRTKKEKRQN